MLIPLAALAAVVAPVIDHVNVVTEQLSAVTGFVITTEATQVPAPTFDVTFDGQEIVGLMLSANVTLNEQVDELPLSSVAVIVTACTVPNPDRIVPATGD